MLKEGSGIISREQAESIALDEVKNWKGVKNAEIVSIKKIHVEDDGYSYWDINGKYEFNEGSSGSFILHIREEGEIEYRLSVAYPIPEGRTVPYPHS